MTPYPIEIKTASTSLTSAKVLEDIVLRDGDTTRLIFRATLVDNPRDVNASVDGSLLFQRKGRNDDWEDWKDTRLTTLKKFEGVELALGSEEFLRLYEGLSKLYDLHHQQGVPRGTNTFVAIGENLMAVARLSEDDLAAIAGIDVASGRVALSNLLRWALRIESAPALVAALEELGPEAHDVLAHGVRMDALRRACAFWTENQSNTAEEFWQRAIAARPFILESLFLFPVVLVAEKAYVGGKTVENQHGRLADYLVKNQLTGNAALIEIKTPSSLLLGPQYRAVLNASSELTGGVLQVLDYRLTLTQEIHTLVRNSADTFDAFRPQCILVIGHTGQLDSEEKRRSFELYRGQLRDVEVVTFDELFGRLERILTALTASPDSE